jgi:hypothetical protein
MMDWKMHQQLLVANDDETGVAVAAVDITAAMGLVLVESFVGAEAVEAVVVSAIQHEEP